MKSICLALFSAFSGSQVCDSRIHLEIKIGEQPLPKQNSIILKVSRSPIGFRQKAIRRSFGQHLMGKKASPLMVLKRSALSSEISLFERCLTVSRYSRSVAIALEWRSSFNSLNWWVATSRKAPRRYKVNVLCRFALFRYLYSKVWHWNYKWLNVLTFLLDVALYLSMDTEEALNWRVSLILSHLFIGYCLVCLWWSREDWIGVWATLNVYHLVLKFGNLSYYTVLK